MNGETVKALRIYFGFNQRKFAEVIGITAAYLCMIESNHRTVSDTVRIRIAQRFEVTEELREALRRSKLAAKLMV